MKTISTIEIVRKHMDNGAYLYRPQGCELEPSQAYLVDKNGTYICIVEHFPRVLSKEKRLECYKKALRNEKLVILSYRDHCKSPFVYERKLEKETIHRRFENKKELEKVIEKLFGKKSELEDCTNQDYMDYDYELCCEVGDYYVTFYYLLTRSNEMYITEVSVENA